MAVELVDFDRVTDSLQVAFGLLVALAWGKSWAAPEYFELAEAQAAQAAGFEQFVGLVPGGWRLLFAEQPR